MKVASNEPSEGLRPAKRLFDTAKGVVRDIWNDPSSLLLITPVRWSSKHGVSENLSPTLSLRRCDIFNEHCTGSRLIATFLTPVSTMQSR